MVVGVGFAQAKCETPNIEVVRTYDASCPEALLDARELRKAFLNLLLNGLESLREGGRLTVTTVYAADTRTMTIVIEDTGARTP